MPKKMTALNALRADARNWWWHAELRRQGRHDAAKVLERKSVRDDVRQLRYMMDNGVESYWLQTRCVIFRKDAKPDPFGAHPTSISGMHNGMWRIVLRFLEEGKIAVRPEID